MHELEVEPGPGRLQAKGAHKEIESFASVIIQVKWTNVSLGGYFWAHLVELVKWLRNVHSQVISPLSISIWIFIWIKNYFIQRVN